MVTDVAAKYKPLPFSDRLRARAAGRASWLCIGLDPEIGRLPYPLPRSVEGVVRFCQEVVDGTSDLAAAYKINLAFFEALGVEGWRAIRAVRQSVPRDVPVIADAKRGDIANSARAYAQALLDTLDFDAVTVNPYMGRDSVAPFLEYPGKAAFVLCKTSNPGANDFQELRVDGDPLYMHVARSALRWSGSGEIALVVGATHPEAVSAIRSLDSDAILLMVGVGAQGADAADAMRRGANGAGQNALLSVSREVLYASSGPEYVEAARGAAERRARDTRPFR